MGKSGLIPVLSPSARQPEHPEVEDALGGLRGPVASGPLEADLAARPVQRLHGAGVDAEASRPEVAGVEAEQGRT